MNILVIGNTSSIHDLKWITYLSENSNHDFFFTQEGQNLPPTSNQLELYKKANVKILDTLPSFSIIKIWSTILGWIKVKRFIKENKIDLIHVIFPTPHIYWATFTKLSKIVTTRGSDVLIVIKNLIENPTLKNKLLLWLMKYNLQKTQHVTCTSELQEEFLYKHFPFLIGKTSIVRTGINIEFINSIKVNKEESYQINIFSPRFFLAIYNIENIILAINKLPIEIQQKIHLQLVKGKKRDANYEASILKLLEKVVFKYSISDYYNQEELIREYKKSDLIIMIPHSDGTPNSALETMICKKPLIMSKLNYQSPLFDNTCLFANPNDIQKISEKIETSINNYPTHLLQKASDSVLKYGNQKIEMEKILKIYGR